LPDSGERYLSTDLFSESLPLRAMSF
jgi:hypothetical protein